MLLIKNASIYGKKPQTLVIEDEKIVHIGDDAGAYKGDYFDEVLDFEGCLTLPSGIDAHTHIWHDMGGYATVDTFDSASMAAIYGGTAGVIDHITGMWNSPTAKTIEKYKRSFSGNEDIHIQFHGLINKVHSKLESEVLDALNYVNSMKIYTTYGYMLSDYEILKVFELADKLGFTVCIHSENDAIIKYEREKRIESGKLETYSHFITRPSESESEMTDRLLFYKERFSNLRLYFVHISSADSIDVLRKRRNAGQRFGVETCTQYLVMDRDEADKNLGALAICSPPIREKNDIEELWKGIEDGTVDVIATDHCPFEKGLKLKHKDDFTKVPGGIPGLQERMPVVLSEAKKRGFSFENISNLLAKNPAKLFGQKHRGEIAVGMKADIVVWKNGSYTWSQTLSKGRQDYSVFEGRDIDYAVKHHIIDGKLIIRDGNYLGKIKL